MMIIILLFILYLIKICDSVNIKRRTEALSLIEKFDNIESVTVKNEIFILYQKEEMNKMKKIIIDLQERLSLLENK